MTSQDPGHFAILWAYSEVAFELMQIDKLKRHSLLVLAGCTQAHMWDTACGTWGVSGARRHLKGRRGGAVFQGCRQEGVNCL